LWADIDDDPSRLNLEFAVLPLDSSVAKRELFYTDDGEPVYSRALKLSMNTRERSDYLRYRGVNPMPIYSKGKDEEGKDILIPEYSVQFDGRSGQWLVMLDKVRDEAAPPHRSFVMAYNEREFPEGSLLFFNTTNAKFYGVLGKERVDINPGANTPMDISQYYDSEIPVGLVVEDGEQVHKVLYSKIRFFPERRTLMILRPPKREGSYRIQAQRLTEYLGKFDDDDPGA